MRKYTLDVKRTGKGVVGADGVITTPVPDVFQIKASVQPILKRELMSNPDLRDRKEAYKLFSDTLLRTAEAPQQEADIVTIWGRDFTVESVDPWKNGIIEHIRVVVSR
jgi:hypothetical protein